MKKRILTVLAILVLFLTSCDQKDYYTIDQYLEPKSLAGVDSTEIERYAYTTNWLFNDNGIVKLDSIPIYKTTYYSGYILHTEVCWGEGNHTLDWWYTSGTFEEMKAAKCEEYNKAKQFISELEAKEAKRNSEIEEFEDIECK